MRLPENSFENVALSTVLIVEQILVEVERGDIKQQLMEFPL